MNEETNNKMLTSDEKLTAIEQYPALNELPERAREVLILTAIGYTQDLIAKRLGCTQSAISQAIKRYDPDGVYKPDMDLRKAVVRTSLGTVALEATRHLLTMTEKLKDYQPKTLLEIISKCEELQEGLKGGGGKSRSVQDVLDKLSTT
jgi:predicted transcriptional regulator